ncbi:L,D-transpeptidase [Acidihalobacter aeolianus]|uniref:L,D-transpeptidase n=1 Tax=Acidihalobacter aeolianus TaxID=2792603 RepID=UPI0009F6AE39|nr:L,D-transpeptidase [Acidihalobacter aeolianus]
MLRNVLGPLCGLVSLLLCATAVRAETIPLALPPDHKTVIATPSGEASAQTLAAVARELARRYPGPEDAHVIVVDVRQQRLYLLDHGHVQLTYRVSTSQWGIGNREGSNRTPVGVFRIAQKFGEGAPAGTIFKSRRDTGKLARIITNPENRSERDLVTSRVMWLTGLQPGFNEGGDVDTHSRYIYIHGTPEEGRIGIPSSHGCVRMMNKDVIELFSQVPVGTLVYIAPGNRPLTDIPNHF